MTDGAAPNAPALSEAAAKPARRHALPWNTRWLGVGLIVVLLLALGSSGSDRQDAVAELSAHERNSRRVVAPHISRANCLASSRDSLWRMFAGYFIGVLLGVLLGLLMGYFRFFYNLLEPITEVLRPIPSPAYLPIVILFLGIDDEMKIFMIAFASLFPVLINTYSGVRSVDPIQLQTARTFGVTGRKLIWQIVLPASSPYIFTGMRVSLAVALIVMVISEMVAASSGIGYFILSAQRGFQIREMFAGVLTLAVVGYVLNRLFVAIENRVLAWHYGYTQQQRH